MERASLLWLPLFFLVAALVQLLQGGNYFDGDTGYHLAVARILAEQGLPDAASWTRMSWLVEHYADKELALHLLMVPVAHLEPNLAARIVGAGLGGLALGTLFLLLRAEQIPRAGLWPLVALFSSGAFVHRFALVRPHLLSIPLALVVLWAASRRRWAALALACFLFPLSYTAWHLPLVLVALVETARWLAAPSPLPLRGRLRPSLTPVAVTLAGLALGVLLHPDFPTNLAFFWVQNVDVLLGTAWAGAAGFELGGEFKPFSPLGVLRYLLLPGGFALAAAALAWPRRKDDVLPLALALAALAFLVLTLRTQRFVEYLAPVGAFALAVAWGRERWPSLPAALTLLGLGWIAAVGMHPIAMLRDRSILFPPAVAEELDRLVPEQADLVTCDWEFTGEMMLALPSRSFLVALDPVFFWKAHPDAYRAWFSLVREPPARPAAVARDTLRGEYVLCDSRERWRPFLSALDADPEARFIARVGFWNLFALPPGPWEPPPAP